MAIAEPEAAREPPPLVTVLHGWVTTVDHKRIGVMYLMATLTFLVAGGVEALLMRVQLWRGGLGLLRNYFKNGLNRRILRISDTRAHF